MRINHTPWWCIADKDTKQWQEGIENLVQKLLENNTATTEQLEMIREAQPQLAALHNQMRDFHKYLDHYLTAVFWSNFLDMVDILAAAAKEISVDFSFWHCLLHCLQYSRGIFAACRSVRCLSSACFPVCLSFSNASPSGMLVDAHMNPEPQLWSRMEIRLPYCCWSFNLRVIDLYESAVFTPSCRKMALYWSRSDFTKYPHMSWKTEISSCRRSCWNATSYRFCFVDFPVGTWCALNASMHGLWYDISLATMSCPSPISRRRISSLFSCFALYIMFCWLFSVDTLHVGSLPSIHRLLQMSHAFFASNVGVAVLLNLEVWEDVLHPSWF